MRRTEELVAERHLAVEVLRPVDKPLPLASCVVGLPPVRVLVARIEGRQETVVVLEVRVENALVAELGAMGVQHRLEECRSGLRRPDMEVVRRLAVLHRRPTPLPRWPETP